MVERTIRNLGMIYIIAGGYMLVSIIPLMSLGDTRNFYFLIFNGLWTVALGSVLRMAKVVKA